MCLPTYLPSTYILHIAHNTMPFFFCFTSLIQIICNKKNGKQKIERKLFGKQIICQSLFQTEEKHFNFFQIPLCIYAASFVAFLFYVIMCTYIQMNFFWKKYIRVAQNLQVIKI